jgi:hypothetical protein
MRKIALFAISLIVLSCETHKCRYPTEGIMEIGEVRGSVSFYGLSPNDLYLGNRYAFLSKIQFSSMPSYENAMAYINDEIIKIAHVRSTGEYIFPDVPPGSYYISIGAFDSPWFHFMSYHSITPYVVVKMGETFNVTHIELLPGGGTSLEWFLDGRDSTNQGFNFSKGENVASPDSADLWYDGENQKLITQGNNIVKIPGEQEGLCFITSAPDTGYYSELFIPFREFGDTGKSENFQYVVKTQDGRYAKSRKTGGEYGVTSGSVWFRRIDIQWMLQPDGSKKFSY